MSAFWLTARVRRRDGVEVWVPLGSPGDTVFVESGESPPAAAAVLRLTPDPDGRPRVELAAADERSLPEVLMALWPAAEASITARLEKALKIDNRLDLETELQAFADLVDALVAWVRSQAIVTGPVAHGLRRHRPDLVALLDLEVDESAAEAARRSGGRIAEHFPEWFTAEEATGPPSDAQAWAAWTDRDAPEILGADGGLSRLMGEGFEVRQGQLDMAERVTRVLERGEHLMVEAGTGIGKSLAYLVPTLLEGAREGERVIVSTYTKALQTQLLDHDLPLLARLGYPGRARVLLGRNNYLCRRQLRRALGARVEDGRQARAQLALAVWSKQSREGRRAELADHPWFEDGWRAYFESVEPCSPHICHKDPICFVVRARRVAREAPVVVVNHSLLMMDLKSSQSLMGPARLLVVDEAHQLPEVATRALSHWVARERLEVYRNLSGERVEKEHMREVLVHLARAATREDGESKIPTMAAEADAHLERFLAAFERWFLLVETQGRERLGSQHHRVGSHRYHDGAEAFGATRAESDHLLECAAQLDRSLAALLGASGDLEEKGRDLDDEREGLASLLEFHREFSGQIRFCLEASDEDWVYWLEWAGERGLAAVVAAPLTVEEPLARLWDTHYRSVVMTSATLAVETDFLPFAESVGFSRVKRFTDSLQVPSPFAHEEQALMLTALDLPSPDEAEFADRIADVVAKIALRVRTKTLVLSTSYRLIDQIRSGLDERLERGGGDLFRAGAEPVRPELLVQRPGAPRGALADRFRRAEAAVLLATGSFWEGIDFPGEQLEVLVVPRLPFAVPTEPITEGRFERARRLGRDPFQDVSLVDAVLRLKQGVGRLLRTREDRGVVLLLDQRLQTKAYGVSFLNSLPRLCELVPHLDEVPDRVVEFLKQGPATQRSRPRG